MNWRKKVKNLEYAYNNWLCPSCGNKSHFTFWKLITLKECPTCGIALGQHAAIVCPKCDARYSIWHGEIIRDIMKDSDFEKLWK